MRRSTVFTAILALLSQHYAESFADEVDEADEPWMREMMLRSMKERAHLAGRQDSDQDLSFCFGKGSICAVGSELYSTCSAYNLDNSLWYDCICASGYITINQACYDCQLTYNLTVVGERDSLEKSCKSRGFSIAPMPASVISKEARYNATFTGIITGAPTGSLAPNVNATGRPESEPTIIKTENGGGDPYATPTTGPAVVTVTTGPTTTGTAGAGSNAAALFSAQDACRLSWIVAFMYALVAIL